MFLLKFLYGIEGYIIVINFSVVCCVTDRSFLVANFQNNSCHIIYCSDGFCRLSGFSRAEVMQRPASCDFMHGPLTSQHAVNVVREALAAGQEKHFEILYYRKDGEFSSTLLQLKFKSGSFYNDCFWGGLVKGIR